MISLDKNSEEYKVFRKRANKNNRKYFNKPEVKAKRRLYKIEYELKNNKKLSEYTKQYRSRPEVIERRKLWNEKNKEILRIKAKEWRIKNKERKNRLDREYGKRIRADPILHKKFLKKQKAIRINKKDIIKKYNQKYYTSPKGVITYTKHNHRRLSLIRQRPTDLTCEKIQEIRNRDKVCVYCGSNNKLELDHILSLNNGGNSMSNNFVMACENCNRTKSGKDVFEWCKENNREVPNIAIQLIKSQSENLTP